MVKRIVLPIALILILAATAGYLFATGRIPLGKNFEVQSIKFFDFRKFRPPFTCQAVSGNFESNIYFGNNQLRSELAKNNPDGTTKYFMIVDENSTYFWNNLIKSGSKTSSVFNDFELGDTILPTSDAETPKTMKYTCTGWAEDKSLFIPPTDIAFEQVIPAANTSTEGGIIILPKVKSGTPPSSPNQPEGQTIELKTNP